MLAITTYSTYVAKTIETFTFCNTNLEIRDEPCLNIVPCILRVHPYCVVIFDGLIILMRP